MVFPIGKRKITHLNESNNTKTASVAATSSASQRRPLSTTSNETRSSKLKSISNDLIASNKNIKLSKSSKQHYDDSPKSKLNKLNEIKLSRNNIELNKKTSIKQLNHSDPFNLHHHPQQMSHYTYADNYSEDMFNFESEETFQKYEKQYEKHIKTLHDQLEKLNQLEELAKEKKLNSNLIKQTISDFHPEGYNYLSKFLNEIQRVEKESNENVSIVKNWYEKQKQEIELQYTIEQKRALQEFQDKRRELKESLRNENEEKRRKIETDRTTADINMDNSDPKPTTTRKLRRRFNGPISNLTSNANANFDFSMDSNNFDIDPETLGIGSSSSAVLLQSGVISTSALGLTTGMVASALCSTVNTNVSNVNKYYADTLLNNLTSSNNERKRKLGPAAITFTISEDEINEDLKCLS